jgi:hypothetical protein
MLIIIIITHTNGMKVATSMSILTFSVCSAHIGRMKGTAVVTEVHMFVHSGI